MGGQNSKGGDKRPSSSLHLRDKKELAGVGLIFRKSPDGFLVVKEVLGGSSADESGSIEPGDILTQVDEAKVAKASIADISAMVLGEPGMAVKLKFSRSLGKSKKKFKVTLKRTVRATLEPTYHVQRDGINTKVTHIHLDCLQNADDGGGGEETAVGAGARDVLDANGNVVGPGLLQKARLSAAAADPIPGVERLDASHPAWPGNSGKKNSKVTRAGSVNNTGHLPALKNKGSAPDLMAAASPAKNAPPPAPRSQSAVEQPPPPPQAPAPEDNLSPGALPPSSDPPPLLPLPGEGEEDIAAMLNAFTAPAPATVPPLDPPTIEAEPTPPPPPVPEPPLPEFEEPVIKFDPPPPAPVEQPPAPPVEEQKAPPEEEEEEEEELDFAGLAESRVLMFEAKSKAEKPASKNSKKVNLEEEWARSAALKEKETSAETSNLASPAPPTPAPVQEDKTESKPVAASPAATKEVKAEEDKASSRPPWQKPVASQPEKAEKEKAEPKKFGGPAKGPAKKMGGGGDLAAMMAARKKQMDENEDDGYYF